MCRSQFDSNFLLAFDSFEKNTHVFPLVLGIAQEDAEMGIAFAFSDVKQPNGQNGD